MEFPVKDVVNTGEDTLLLPAQMDPMTQQQNNNNTKSNRVMLTCTLDRSRNPREKWGFRLQGGKDRGLALQLLQIPLNSVAGKAGCRSNDYLVKIQGQDVFNMSHDEAKKIIGGAGSHLSLVVERGDHIVPSMNEAFPNYAKKKEEPMVIPTKDKPYYQRVLEEKGELPGQGNKGFTTVGKPKMTTKQYNSPLEIYGDEALEEIMEQGTLFGREVDTMNPWNLTGKELDLNKSEVLSLMNQQNGSAK